MAGTVGDLWGPSAPEWAAALTAVEHDFYHLPSYVGLEAEREGGTALAYVGQCDGTWLLLPLIVRALPDRVDPCGAYVDATSPYGYGGPVTNRGACRPALDVLVADCRRALAERNAVALFLRMHPIHGAMTEHLVDAPGLVCHGQTVYVDLAALPADARAGYRRAHRYDVRQLEASGFRAVVDDWHLYDEFIRLYLGTMDRVESSDYYRFSPDYFAALRSALGDRLHLCSVLAPDGAVAAGGLFVECGPLMQYHLSGTSSVHARSAPTKLMLDCMIREGVARGLRHLHLGGGVGCREDNLFLFKAGFSSLRAEFHSYREVLQPAAYQDLCRRRSCDTDPTDLMGFFPAYRQ